MKIQIISPDMKKIFTKIFCTLLLLFPSISSAKILQMDYPLSRQAVWRATLIAMSFYPLETTNYDQGLIKTKILTEGDSWKPVFRSINSEHIYTINVNVFNYGGRTRVSIDKKLNRKASFERNEQELKTLGVEEDMLLYRIKRELLIDRLIKKYFK